MKRDIRTLTQDELSTFFTEHGEKAFRAKQAWEWIHRVGVQSFDEMTNLSKTCRALLEENFTSGSLKEVERRESSDGTTKLAFQLFDGRTIEGVMIPSQKERATACISSQVGCPLHCSFCATGQMGFLRNLSASEIFDQVVLLKRVGEEKGYALDHIVLMGMGEPLLNFDNVLSAIDWITDENGLAMSPARITLSTSGITDAMRRLADLHPRFNLAVSLHSAVQNVRSRIMPVAERYDLNTLSDAIDYFVTATGTRPTFEYLLLKGVNDAPSDAEALARFCRRFPVKINIIEYNEVPSIQYKKSDAASRDRFIKILEEKHMIVNVRRSKGDDIAAACGQLAKEKTSKNR